MTPREPHESSAPAATPDDRPAVGAWARPRILFREPIESLVAGCTGTGAKTPVNVPMCSFGGS